MLQHGIWIPQNQMTKQPANKKLSHMVYNKSTTQMKKGDSRIGYLIIGKLCSGFKERMRNLHCSIICGKLPRSIVCLHKYTNFYRLSVIISQTWKVKQKTQQKKKKKKKGRERHIKMNSISPPMDGVIPQALLVLKVFHIKESYIK